MCFLNVSGRLHSGLSLLTYQIHSLERVHVLSARTCRRRLTVSGSPLSDHFVQGLGLKAKGSSENPTSMYQLFNRLTQGVDRLFRGFVKGQARQAHPTARGRPPPLRTFARRPPPQTNSADHATMQNLVATAHDPPTNGTHDRSPDRSRIPRALPKTSRRPRRGRGRPPPLIRPVPRRPCTTTAPASLPRERCGRPRRSTSRPRSSSSSSSSSSSRCSRCSCRLPFRRSCRPLCRCSSSSSSSRRKRRLPCLTFRPAPGCTSQGRRRRDRGTLRGWIPRESTRRARTTTTLPGAGC